MNKPDNTPTTPPLTVAYVVKGFWGYLHDLDKRNAVIGEFEEIKQGGEINLMDELIDRAAYVEDEWLRLSAKDDADFSGVWDYDVSEEFGYQLAVYAVNHNQLPDEGWCRLKVTELSAAALD